MRFAERLSLRSIHLHKCSQERGDGELGMKQTMEAEASLSPVEWEDSDLAYTVTLQYHVTNGNNGVLARGDVTFLAAYDLEAGAEPTEEEVRDYAFHGVVFQVHPFIREHVASMCQRAGLTPYLLPTMIRSSMESGDAAEPSTDDQVSGATGSSQP